jgi:hypothetical protein
MHTKFWSETLKGIDHSEDLGVEETVILEPSNSSSLSNEYVFTV